MKTFIPLPWVVGHHSSNTNHPDTWYQAEVPGAVQLDMAKAYKYGPHWYAENWKDYRWMEDRFFTYRTNFTLPDLAPGERLIFSSLGIDYRFDILLNSELLLSQEGMFSPVWLDITGKITKENTIEVIIYPIPKSEGKTGRFEAERCVKPAVSYGWDWHPRLVPSGIWDKTGLIILPTPGIRSASTTYQLSDSLDRATIFVQANLNQPTTGRYTYALAAPDGTLAYSKNGNFEGEVIQFTGELSDPQLWWPHDHGSPALYTATLQVTDLLGNLQDVSEQQIGFRRVKLVMNTGAWNEPSDFPKTRSVPPATFEINDRRIFAKGTNWVNPDIFPGIIGPQQYSDLIKLAKAANFNILRVWGGGIVNKQVFYDLCDREGLLVWQEFPLACNNYPSDKSYLDILCQEATSIIGRLRQHACLALWCGGNELFNVWSGMDDQSLALRMLNSLCFEHDPHTPFIATSPLMGMAHGHYVFRDDDNGEEVFQVFARAKNTAYTEYGVSSPSSADILRDIIPAEELWPPRPGTAWESHHGFNAWVGDTWLRMKMIEHYFGPAGSLEQLVEQGQLLQGEGLKFIYEEARRQKPYCSMTLNWCFNEPWPTAANSSIINWPARPKPAYYEVAKACRAIMLSARIDKFTWTEGELFETELFLLNDSYHNAQPGMAEVWLHFGETAEKIGFWEYAGTDANANLEGPVIRYRLPHRKDGLVRLEICDSGHPEMSSSYWLLYAPSEVKEATQRGLNQ